MDSEFSSSQPVYSSDDDEVTVIEDENVIEDEGDNGELNNSLNAEVKAECVIWLIFSTNNH